MQKERLYIYDTTLRDGQQTQGVQFSLDEKLSIIRSLDELGVDYIEGGWPGANPVDTQLFERKEKTRNHPIRVSIYTPILRKEIVSYFFTVSFLVILFLPASSV